MRVSLVLGAALLTSALVQGEEKLPSGLKSGDSMPLFEVKDVTGPHKDKPEVCYI